MANCSLFNQDAWPNQIYWHNQHATFLIKYILFLWRFFPEKNYLVWFVYSHDSLAMSISLLLSFGVKRTPISALESCFSRQAVRSWFVPVLTHILSSLLHRLIDLCLISWWFCWDSTRLVPEKCLFCHCKTNKTEEFQTYCLDTFGCWNRLCFSYISWETAYYLNLFSFLTIY